MTRGFWAVFDGPNGTGKSTAMRAVAERLRADGFDVIETREPGGSPLAEQIRGLILDSSNKMDTTTQLLLFNAARRSHLEEMILPQLAAGRVVLCDRFLASSLVFQSLNPDGTKNLDDAFILEAHRLFCRDARPHLSIYLDAPLEVRRSRIATRAGAILDRFEEYDDSFDRAAADKFRACGALIDQDHVTIDASSTPEEVTDAAYHALVGRIAGRRYGAIYRTLRSPRWIALMDPASEGREPLLSPCKDTMLALARHYVATPAKISIVPEREVHATLSQNLAA